MSSVEVLPPEVPNAMPTTEQLLTVGAQLVEALVERLREAGDGEADATPDAARAPDVDSVRLRRAYLGLRRRNEQVSRALGACRCWGRRRECPICGGEGRPGFFPIDPGAFAAFVAPAVVAEPEVFLALVTVNAAAGPRQRT
jgi:hypothetical protein